MASEAHPNPNQPNSNPNNPRPDVSLGPALVDFNIQSDDEDNGGNTESVLSEDPMPERIAQAYMGTVILNPIILNPNWGSGTGANRPINESNVNNLVNSFKTTIRRWTPDTRMKASCSRESWGQVIEYNQANSPHVSNVPLHLQDQARQGQWRYRRTDILEITWRQSDPAQGEEEEDPDNTPRPILEAGQHRRAALMKYFGLQDNLEGYRQEVYLR